MLLPDFMVMTLYDLAEALDRGVLQIDLGETVCIRAAYLGVPISISSPSYEEAMGLFLAQMERIRKMEKCDEGTTR